MARILQCYGVGQALIPVFPPPIGFENPPTSNQTNFEIGQIAYTPIQSPTAFYMYRGAGNWNTVASTTSILDIVGTANQIVANTVSGVTTLSISNSFVVPGSITAANGNLFLGTAGNKIRIATGVNASVGTTGPLVGGTIVINNTAITATSLVFFSTNTLGTVAIPQSYYVSARNPGVSFTIKSSSAMDTSTVNYWIIN